MFSYYSNLLDDDSNAGVSAQVAASSTKPSSITPSNYRRHCPVDPDLICEVVLASDTISESIAHIINEVLLAADSVVNRLDIDSQIINEMLNALEWDAAYDEVLHTCVDKVTRQRESIELPSASSGESTIDRKAIERVFAIRQRLRHKKVESRMKLMHRTKRDEEVKRYALRRRKSSGNTRRENQIFNEECHGAPTLTSAAGKCVKTTSQLTDSPTASNLSIEDVLPQGRTDPPKAIVNLIYLSPTRTTKRKPKKIKSTPSTLHKKIKQANAKEPSKRPKKTIKIKKKSPKSVSHAVATTWSPDANIDYSLEWKRLRSINLSDWDNHLRQEMVRFGVNEQSGRRSKRRKPATTKNIEKRSKSVKQLDKTPNDTIQAVCGTRPPTPASGSKVPKIILKPIVITNMSTLLDTPIKDHVVAERPETLVKASAAGCMTSPLADANHQQREPVCLHNESSNSSGSLSSYSGTMSGVEDMDAQSDPKLTKKPVTIFTRQFMHKGLRIPLPTAIKLEEDDEDVSSPSNASIIDQMQIVYDGSSCYDDSDSDNRPIIELFSKGKYAKSSENTRQENVGRFSGKK